MKDPLLTSLIVQGQIADTASVGVMAACGLVARTVHEGPITHRGATPTRQTATSPAQARPPAVPDIRPARGGTR